MFLIHLFIIEEIGSHSAQARIIEQYNDATFIGSESLSDNKIHSQCDIFHYYLRIIANCFRALCEICLLITTILLIKN